MGSLRSDWLFILTKTRGKWFKKLEHERADRFFGVIQAIIKR